MLDQSFLVPIIKVTDSCNFSCGFCHYAQKALAGKLMTADMCAIDFEIDMSYYYLIIKK